MSTTIFSIANQKGGVGKTTTAVNLSTGLARRGISTLLIDLDPQGNATSSLGFEKKAGHSLYNSLHGEDSASNKILSTSQKNLAFIPSEVDLTAIEIELGHKENYLFQLRSCLQPIVDADSFQVILLDCPPALGLLSMNSLVAAHYLLVTLQCEYLAMEGLSQILSVVRQLQEAQANPSLKIGGILMTMYDTRTKLSKQVWQEVGAHFPDLIFKSIIPRSVRLSEAPSFGQSIFQYDRRSSGAKAYDKLSRELIRRFSLSTKKKSFFSLK